MDDDQPFFVIITYLYTCPLFLDEFYWLFNCFIIFLFSKKKFLVLCPL